MKNKFFVSVFILLLGIVKCNSQINKAKIGDTIYGDFNGDGNFEYAYSILIKKEGDYEELIRDKYEVRFSDKKINSIKGDINRCTLINEGDLNRDGSDEITLVKIADNGCINWGSTYTVKNGNCYYLIDVFEVYSGACDNDISIDFQDLVENDNGIGYYYEYNPDVEYSLNSVGKKIKYAKKIKAFEVNPIIENIDVVKKREENIKNDNNTSFDFEVKPDFPGGMSKFFEFFNKNFQKPTERGLVGMIYTTFFVEKDGSLTDIKVLRDIGFGTGKEAIRVLKLSPKWIPAEKNFEKVRYLYSIPIRIQSE